MSRRALGFLCYGLGIASSPLLAIGSMLLAELLQRRNLR